MTVLNVVESQWIYKANTALIYLKIYIYFLFWMKLLTVMDLLQYGKTAGLIVFVCTF